MDQFHISSDMFCFVLLAAVWHYSRCGNHFQWERFKGKRFFFFSFFVNFSPYHRYCSPKCANTHAFSGTHWYTFSLTHTHTHRHIHRHTPTHAHTCTRLHIHTHTYTHGLARTCSHRHGNTLIHVLTPACAHTCVHERKDWCLRVGELCGIWPRSWGFWNCSVVARREVHCPAPVTHAELPTVTFWPYFDTVTLKMYGNTVCSKKYGSKPAKNYGCQKLSRFRKFTKVCHRCSCFASFCTQAEVCLATGVRRKKNLSYL